MDGRLGNGRLHENLRHLLTRWPHRVKPEVLLLNDYGVLTLVPTLVVVVLALWTHRTIESLLAGSIVGLFILDPSAPLQLLADKSLAVMMNETVAWIILVCFFMGSLIALFIRTGAISAFTALVVERLNGSIRRECTDHVIVFGESHLRRILRCYFEYYNNDRTHLGLNKETPMERPISNRASSSTKLVALPRVGGLHNRYEWSEAA